MNGDSTFVVYRVGLGGVVAEVFETADMKKAKYWIMYIAEPGDALFRTPRHPKHSQKSNVAEYWTHRENQRELYTDESRWTNLMRRLFGDFSLPLWKDQRVEEVHS